MRHLNNIVWSSVSVNFERKLDPIDAKYSFNVSGSSEIDFQCLSLASSLSVPKKVLVEGLNFSKVSLTSPLSVPKKIGRSKE